MKTLVIVAHPNLARSRVNKRWVQELRQNSDVTIRILAETIADGHFDVASEQEVLAAHDRIIWQFPFYWYNCPPILKTWIDNVLEHGWAYGPGGTALEGKELGLAISTWSRPQDYTSEGKYHRTMEELTSPFEAIAIRVGMEYKPGFFLNGVGDHSERQLDRNAKEYVAWTRSSAVGIRETSQPLLEELNR